ncbi:MAG: hypothetical protein M1308_16660, partial [Actinobacteria bacterium]|nr:hypothetical protein [Actinomycetota bacterium]
NPFEKLGLLVILPASIIAAIGVRNLWDLSKAVYLKVIIILLIIGCGIYVWPMWSDKLFGSDKYPLFFTLPADYKEVSNFLSDQLKLDDGKILHLPISEGDSATYDWKYPYNGTEIASYLFPGVSISKFLYISFIDHLLEESSRIFHTTNYALQKQILSIFNVKYIVLNKNLDWYVRKVDNPLFVERILDASPDLKVIKQTANLKVYKFIASPSQSVFPANNLRLLSGNFNKGREADFTLNKTPENNAVFLQQVTNQQFPGKLLQDEIILPQRTFANESTADKNPNIVIPRPYIKYLPGTPYYQPILLKEQIELWLAPSYQRPMQMLLLTQKRVMESQRLKEQKKYKEFNYSIGRYSNYLKEAISKIRGIPVELLEDENLKVVLRVALNEEKEVLEGFKGNIADREINLLIDEDIKQI